MPGLSTPGYPESTSKTIFRRVDAAVIMLVHTTMSLAAGPRPLVAALPVQRLRQV